jgi:Uncharacterized protein conserved in archaea
MKEIFNFLNPKIRDFGGFKVKYENGIYLCPVKGNQKDNPGAVCGFCIAEQDESFL